MLAIDPIIASARFCNGSRNCDKLGNGGIPGRLGFGAGYKSTIAMIKAMSINAAPAKPSASVPGNTNNSTATRTNPSPNTASHSMPERPAT